MEASRQKRRLSVADLVRLLDMSDDEDFDEDSGSRDLDYRPTSYVMTQVTLSMSWLACH